MRIISWNVHGARKDSQVWGFLLDLKPDLVLLQEIGSIPISVTERFHCLIRKAVSKTGKPQRFATGVLAGAEIADQFALSSRYQWVNEQIEFFKGNFINCTVQLPNRPPLNVLSVHSPAWPVDKTRLAGLDLSEVKHETNPYVWGTDILWDALRNTMRPGETWVVGGDFNSSETFDSNWQDRHGRRFGIRSSGNAETLERMRRLGLTECLRQTSEAPIIPTFRHSRGGIDHQIDHLFVSTDLSSTLDNCTVGDQALVFGGSLSDHLPIIADFRNATSSP